MRLLNRWTRAFAARIALEGDSPPSAVTPPVTLAAAEAPYADPFLMEFEDQSALNAAYADSPVTFEQALMAARLEAKQAAQVCGGPLLHPFVLWCTRLGAQDTGRGSFSA